MPWGAMRVPENLTAGGAPMSAVWVDVAPSTVVIADRLRLGYPGFRRAGFRCLDNDLVRVPAAETGDLVVSRADHGHGQVPGMAADLRLTHGVLAHDPIRAGSILREFYDAHLCRSPREPRRPRPVAVLAGIVVPSFKRVTLRAVADAPVAARGRVGCRRPLRRV